MNQSSFFFPKLTWPQNKFRPACKTFFTKNKMKNICDAA